MSITFPSRTCTWKEISWFYLIFSIFVIWYVKYKIFSFFGSLPLNFLHIFKDFQSIFSIHCPCHLLTPVTETYHWSQMYFLTTPIIRRKKCKESIAMFYSCTFLSFIILFSKGYLAWLIIRFSVWICRQRTDAMSQAWEETECRGTHLATSPFIFYIQKIVLADT